jgi:hypothetical protein
MPVLQPFREETVGDVQKLRLQLNDVVREANAMSAKLLEMNRVMAESSATSVLSAILPLEVQKTTPSSGVSDAYAKADHQHSILTAMVTGIADSSNSEGTASTLARSDHQHSHGSRGGGSLHDVATTSLAGFMSAANFNTLAALAIRVSQYKDSTLNNTAKSIKLDDAMANSSSEVFGLFIVARKSGATTSAYWFGAAAFGCDSGGTVTQIGATAASGSSLPAGWSVNIQVSSNIPCATVQAGVADGTVNWTVIAVRGIAP